jgi:small subunit ribosomal protein S5
MTPNFRRRRDSRDSRDSNSAFSGQSRQWAPKTELGKRVASGQVTSIDEVFASGQRILEPEIVDALLPDLRDEVLEVTSTQRMTAYGRKQQMRAIVVMGSERGYICVGVGKAAESRDAIGKAIEDAKKNVVKVSLGCSSWECRCGTNHSITRTSIGKNSSTQIEIKPAPRGVGIVANETAKKVLQLAGVKDVWTQTKGRTRNVLNMVLATVDALSKLNTLKEGTRTQQQAAATAKASA